VSWAVAILAAALGSTVAIARQRTSRSLIDVVLALIPWWMALTHSPACYCYVSASG
jgi:hypothetical protein